MPNPVELPCTKCNLTLSDPKKNINTRKTTSPPLKCNAQRCTWMNQNDLPVSCARQEGDIKKY